MAASPENTTVVVPALNEERTLPLVLEGLAACGFSRVVVVDDGSTDRTRELARAGGALVISNTRPRGKSGAVLQGAALVGTEYLALQDADLEYPPENLLKLMGGEEEMAVGARELSRSAMSASSLAANRLFALLLGVPDPFSGQRILRTDFFRSLRLSGSGFTLETELQLEAQAAGARVRFVPVAYRPRTRRQGKKIGLFDFFRICTLYAGRRWLP